MSAEAFDAGGWVIVVLAVIVAVATWIGSAVALDSVGERIVLSTCLATVVGMLVIVAGGAVLQLAGVGQ